jgi:4'-phosphopantetheinyl transferase
MDTPVRDSLQCMLVDISRKESLHPDGFPTCIQKDRIHIWSAGYEDLDRHFRVLAGVIRPEERDVASTFTNTDDTRKYLLRHGVLRSLLAHYTHQDPEQVAFVTGENGKPALDPKGGYADVFFNLSHTSDKILIGVTRNRRIGVDIVKMEPSYPFQKSADYILTPAEKRSLRSVEPTLRYQVFFRIWAIKEAILKTTGGTLALMKTTDLSEIIPDILFSPNYSIKYLKTPPFFIWYFTSEPGHYGALAVDVGNSSCKAENLG